MRTYRKLHLIALSLLGVLTFHPARAAAPECKLQLAADLEVERNPRGGVLVPVLIDGRAAWMVLGLDSGTSAIDPDAMERLGLHAKRITVNPTLGSRVRSGNSPFISNEKKLEQFTKIDSVRVGSINFGGFEALVSGPGGDGVREYRGMPVVGMLGAGALRKFDVELDLARAKLRIFKATECKDPPVYWGLEFTDVLKRLRLIVSSRQEKVYFTLAGGSP
jgi:hypothetical protein